MSIDVNKITSVLAKLKDPQLQQYAQLHKNDPYLMALAMSESNRRKELRAAEPGAQGAQEQPKVVDQMVAEMAPQRLPEEQGIGQLSAGNMNFADGGIVAFAGGGDVERYQAGGLPYDPYAYGYSPLSAEKQQELKARAVAPQLTSMQRDIAAQANFKKMNGLPLTAAEADALAQKAAPTATAAAPVSYDPTENLKKIAQTNAKYVAPAAPTDEAAAVLRRYPKTGAGEAAPTVDTGKKITGTGAPRIASTPPADAAPQGIEALQQKYFNPLDQEMGALRNQRAGLAAGIQELADKDVAATKEAIEKRGDPYKGKEERLAKREGELEGMSTKYAGLALLQAGAAMMSTPGGLGMALGKGVQVGSERYAAGIEKISAAKEKFAEARERLDDLRINRDDMNEKEIRQAERDARAAKLKGQELFYNGAVQDLGMKEKQVTAVFGAAANALNTDKEIAARKQIAAAQIKASLNTPDRALWDQLMASNGNDAVKALEAFKQAKGDKFDLRREYADYVKAFAGKPEGTSTPDSLSVYAGRFGATLPR